MALTQMRIGGHIAALRKAKGLTQEQLAAQLGVTAPAVSKWETDSSYPDITLLCPLARALGVNVDELLQFEEKPSDQEVVAHINDVMQTAMQGDAAAAEAGLDALECYYPEHTPDMVRDYLDLARRYNLHVSAGSDFHGEKVNPSRPLHSVELEIDWLLA